MAYYQMIRGVSKFDLRRQMVERAEEVGISQTAEERVIELRRSHPAWGTSRSF